MSAESFTVQSKGVQVIGVDFPIFLAWLKDTWTPGKHFALCGPTGEGKTTFAVHALQARKWVMALDPKGEDDTLEASGFVRVTKLPLPRKIRNDISEGKPARIILGGSARTDAEERALRELMRRGIAMVRQQGGWTIYADEFQILADLRMFNLGKPIEQLLIAARKNRTSVMTSFQAPAWVPKASTRQAAFVALWPTRDRNMIKAVAEATGRPWHELEAAVDVLPPYYVLVIPSSIHAPIVLVHPPELGK
jgi:hypothetical protein